VSNGGLPPGYIRVKWTGLWVYLKRKRAGYPLPPGSPLAFRILQASDESK